MPQDQIHSLHGVLQLLLGLQFSFAVGGAVYFPTINERQLARTCEARRSI